MMAAQRPHASPRQWDLERRGSSRGEAPCNSPKICAACNYATGSVHVDAEDERTVHNLSLDDSDAAPSDRNQAFSVDHSAILGDDPHRHDDRLLAWALARCPRRGWRHHSGRAEQQLDQRDARVPEHACGRHRQPAVVL
jgi:hypothetical protein